MTPKAIADAGAHRVAQIKTAVASPGMTDATGAFLADFETATGAALTVAGAGDLLAQHIVTRPIFAALFAHHPRIEANPISRAMQPMLDDLGGEDAEPLAPLYEDARKRVADIGDEAEHQRAITDLYEGFFKAAMPKTVAALGIVYTPVEVVDFMLRSADQATRQSHGVGLTAEGVMVIDPFTGTGIFPVRLLQSGLIQPEDLRRKYTSELHAHEIVPLAHYIATINIEAAFHALTRGPYVPYTGIRLADTFDPDGCPTCQPRGHVLADDPGTGNTTVEVAA